MQMTITSARSITEGIAADKKGFSRMQEGIRAVMENHF